MISRNDAKNGHIFYPAGKPSIPHLLCCQGLGVVYYSLTLGRLRSGASSTFATLGFAPQSAIPNRLYLRLLITQGCVALRAAAGIPAYCPLPTAAWTLNELNMLAGFCLLEKLLQGRQGKQETDADAGNNQQVLYRILTKNERIHRNPQWFMVVDLSIPSWRHKTGS